MKIRIESPKENMVTLLRRAGYIKNQFSVQ
jgi:hypothetical protein